MATARDSDVIVDLSYRCGAMLGRPRYADGDDFH
jgi:hypothetical protein